jgi:hypothetical protein
MINDTTPEGEQPATAPALAPPSSGPSKSSANERRQLAGLAAGGVLVGAMVVVALMSGQQSETRGSTMPDGSPAATARGSARTARGGATRASGAAANIKWSATDDRTGRARVVSFELAAENEIGLVDRRMRPMLVLRCAPGSLDAFIVTGGAAAIENDAHSHTVRIGFDGAAEVTERWLDSEERDALFAPSGTAFARQLVGRRAMAFTFAPFGAPQATAEFDLHGFDAMLTHMPKSCRW